MSNGDIIVPPTDLTTAAIEAVNLILTELHISPLQLLLGLFSGKPKFEDTENVIAAYNQSAYWPLHALASDLSIAVKNGAPISDSNPAIQKQFGVWKQGTVTSIQTFAGGEAGAGQPGYWTIFALIEQSWKASGQGEQAVLQYVKALDALTQVLAQENGQTQPPPSVPPSPPGPTAPPCPPFQAMPTCLPQPGAPDQDLDEIGQGFAGVAYWLEIIAIWLMNLYEKGIGGGGPVGAPADPVTCTQLTGLFKQLTDAIAAINISIPPPPPLPEPPPQIDLSAIDADLQAIAAALKNPSDDVAAQLKRIADVIVSDDARGQAVIEYWNGLGLVDQSLAQLLLA